MQDIRQHVRLAPRVARDWARLLGSMGANAPVETVAVEVDHLVVEAAHGGRQYLMTVAPRDWAWRRR